MPLQSMLFLHSHWLFAFLYMWCHSFLLSVHKYQEEIICTEIFVNRSIIDETWRKLQKKPLRKVLCNTKDNEYSIFRHMLIQIVMTRCFQSWVEKDSLPQQKFQDFQIFSALHEDGNTTCPAFPPKIKQIYILT